MKKSQDIIKQRLKEAGEVSAGAGEVSGSLRGDVVYKATVEGAEEDFDSGVTPEQVNMVRQSVIVVFDPENDVDRSTEMEELFNQGYAHLYSLFEGETAGPASPNIMVMSKTPIVKPGVSFEYETVAELLQAITDSRF